ncbi:hypothetical protein C2I18_17065 [Paenibacillus sp. PK3_47]|uniref:hypothetical protein n=1 Tax=Paenibacillus sp. PK3_47 TaxID=2072642 RepID=UPI00201E4F10|nr:hypothetical protein [Paenibacillus sp. PK3_47]UQZ35084.1 hypothetical protein C2I18_17065 [Paenibacillus sp. PK3_47]
MGKGPSEWSGILSAQDIPAEAVNWYNIISSPEESEPDRDSGHLDADATIGELPEEEEQETDRPHTN